MDCSTPGLPVHHQLLEFAQTHVHWPMMPSNHLILCRPLLLLTSIFPNIRVSSNESVLHIRWPKYWSFSISPSNEYSGLISFRIHWLDPCNPRDCQESSPTPWFKSINSSALSFIYSPTLISLHDYWKNHNFDYRDLCQKVMSLLFNMLSRLAIAFLLRSKRLLFSWLQSWKSEFAVILEPQKMKSVTVSTVSPSIFHEVMGSDAMVLLDLNMISQEAGKVFWYSHLFKNFPQFVVIHTKALA